MSAQAAQQSFSMRIPNSHGLVMAAAGEQATIG
jgi:hypothetical protein